LTRAVPVWLAWFDCATTFFSPSMPISV